MEHFNAISNNLYLSQLHFTNNLGIPLWSILKALTWFNLERIWQEANFGPCSKYTDMV